jgi:hypothetical protein
VQGVVYPVQDGLGLPHAMMRLLGHLGGGL